MIDKRVKDKVTQRQGSRKSQGGVDQEPAHCVSLP